MNSKTKLLDGSVLRIFLAIAAVALLWGLGVPTQVSTAAPAVVAWPNLHLSLVSGGLSSPVSMSAPDDQSGRLFVVEQGGTIRILKNHVLLATPFLDVHTLISCCGERGLLGLAFPPGATTTGV